MVIAFIALGILCGGIAAVFTMVSGGTFLLAFAVYSGVGTISVLLGIFGLLLIGGDDTSMTDWDGERPATA